MFPRDVVARDGRRCRLREQRETDAPAVIGLSGKSNRSVLEEQVAVTALHAEGGLGVVAEARGAGVVGHLVVAGPRRPDGGGEIAIFVVNDWRDVGLGRCMIELAVEWGREAGLSSVHVRVDPTNAPAHHLYENLGFVTRSGEAAPDVVMEFPL